MLQNAAIDIAIGLALMYLILSLLCTVINEYIATKLKLRAQSLAAGLQEILDDPIVRNAFYDHGLISGTQSALEKTSGIFKPMTHLVTGVANLTRRINPLAGPAPAAPAAPTAVLAVAAVPPIAPGTPTDAPAIAAAAHAVQAEVPEVRAAPAAAPPAPTQIDDHPSYLSADTFVLALVGSLTGTRLAKDQSVPTFGDVKSAIEALPPSKVKSALLASLMAAGADFDAFRKNAAAWFDDSMERLSGVYKRNLKLISILVGFAVAVIINADTFAVGYTLWSTPSLRDEMAKVAATTVADGLPKQSTQTTTADVEKAFKSASDSLRPMLPIGWPISQWLGLTQDTSAPTPGAQKQTVENAPNKAVTTRTSLQKIGDFLAFLVTKIPGWFVTALALSLGAPFWFDILSKLINIRGAGVKPDRADVKKST